MVKNESLWWIVFKAWFNYWAMIFGFGQRLSRTKTSWIAKNNTHLFSAHECIAKSIKNSDIFDWMWCETIPVKKVLGDVLDPNRLRNSTSMEWNCRGEFVNRFSISTKISNLVEIENGTNPANEVIRLSQKSMLILLTTSIDINIDDE